MLSLAIRVSCLAALCAVLAASPAFSYPETPGTVDHLKERAKWEWKCGKEKGTFQGHIDGKVTHGKLKGDKWHVIGSWTPTGPDKLTVTFKEGALKGKASLERTAAANPTFEGILTRPTGKKEKLHIDLLKD